MARMLGRYRRGPVRSCRSMEHLCARCSDGDETRWRKRQEQRETDALIFAGLDPDEDVRFLHLWRPRQDCRHGCNGGCTESGSERCSFTCHEAERLAMAENPETIVAPAYVLAAVRAKRCCQHNPGTWP